MPRLDDVILVIEDDENDTDFIQRAFAKAGMPEALRIVANGEDAVAYLDAHGRFSDRHANPLPRVIVTDLKMPRMDGLQFLRWLREHPRYRAIPTVVLTSSTAQSDVNAAFALGAAGFFVKPVELKKLDALIPAITAYWRQSLSPELSEAAP